MRLRDAWPMAAPSRRARLLRREVLVVECPNDLDKRHAHALADLREPTVGLKLGEGDWQSGSAAHSDRDGAGARESPERLPVPLMFLVKFWLRLKGLPPDARLTR